jgi:FkbM family methyltransferase
MKTTHKIAIARLLYRVVHGARALFGRGDRQIVVRKGIAYDLDMAQGIDLAIYLGKFERRTALALSELVQSSSLVLDIGANIGAHTLHLANLVGPDGRVFAFEPTDFAFRKLQRNLELNPVLSPRLKVFHCFLSERDDASVPGAVYSSWPLVGDSELHAKHLGREMETLSARGRELDSVLAEYADRKVQLVKIDVDGFECSVLKGATKMLREDKPIFVMELSPYVLEERGGSLAELLSFFIPNGYSFFDEWTGDRLPSTAQELGKLVADGAGMNIIARVTRD